MPMNLHNISASAIRDNHFSSAPWLSLLHADIHGSKLPNLLYDPHDDILRREATPLMNQFPHQSGIPPSASGQAPHYAVHVNVH